MHKRPVLLTAILFAASLAPTGVGQVVAYHDRTSAQHQTQFSSLSRQGYRVVTMSIYGTAASPRYAAVWRRRGGPAFVGFHDATASVYQRFVNQYCPLGYVPTALTATGSGTNARFAGFFERTNTPCYIRHGLTLGQFNDECSSARSNGWRIRTVDVYGTSRSRRYIVSFVRSDASQTWCNSGSASSYQTHFSAFTSGHARPQMVAFSDSNRFVSVWTNDRIGTWVARHNMTSSSYQSYVDTYGQRGMYPISLAASGSGSSRRFAAIWATRETPLPRTFSATGQAVPQLTGFDTFVRDWMRTNDARAAALAVAKDGRLVYARGFNYAEAGYRTTQPDSRFRIASCTKPLTSIAMHIAFERYPRSISRRSRIASWLPLQSVLDPRWNDITIGHLLTHQGGWDRNTAQIGDPMFKDEDISRYLGVPLPISKSNIRHWMSSRDTLQFTPGTSSRYSNFGFMLLGQILERMNQGSNYGQIVQRDVLAPLGILRMSVRGSQLSDRQPGEVLYHPFPPYIDRSVYSNSQPWVPGQYGGWNQDNMDSHGAFVAAAPDYVKVLAAFDLGNGNPLMSQREADAMWTVASGYSTVMDGFFLTSVTDAAGRSVRMFQHGGTLPGTAAAIARREDGYSFAFFTNSDVQIDAAVVARALNNVTNSVTTWPNHDLFPSLGLPSLRSHVRGSFHAVGSGCTVTGSGVATLTASGSPDVGQTATYRLSNAGRRNFCYLMLGAPSPRLPLGSFGAPGCSVYLTPWTSIVTISTDLGVQDVRVRIPDDPALVGLRIRCQFAIAEPAANPLGFATSNALDTTIGGWR